MNLAPPKQSVTRLYDASTDFVRNSVGPQLLSAFTRPILATIRVDPTKPFRDVWAYLLNDVGASFYIIDADLVAYLDGMEVYRQKIIYQGRTWGTAGTPYWLGNANNAALGNIADDVLDVMIAASGPWWVCPWRLNITADRFDVQAGADLQDAGTSNWQAEIAVRSMRGL